MTWWESALFGAPAGGLVGYMSSIFAAGPVARRQHDERANREAQITIGNLARAYGQVLKRGRPGGPDTGRGSAFAAGYASAESRERLAAELLEHTRYLKKRRRKTAIEALDALVGPKTLDAVDAGFEQHGPIGGWSGGPVVGVDGRRDQLERHILLGYHDGVGCKPENRVQCERDHYPQVQDEYGELGLLWLTAQNGHNQYFSDQYVVTLACLDRLSPGYAPRRCDRLRRMLHRAQHRLGAARR